MRRKYEAVQKGRDIKKAKTATVKPCPELVVSDVYKVHHAELVIGFLIGALLSIVIALPKRGKKVSPAPDVIQSLDFSTPVPEEKEFDQPSVAEESVIEVPAPVTVELDHPQLPTVMDEWIRAQKIRAELLSRHRSRQNG